MEEEIKRIEQDVASMPFALKIAIREYTKHVGVNRYLRDVMQGIDDPDVPEDSTRSKLDTAFCCVSPLRQDIEVYRGVKSNSVFTKDKVGVTLDVASHFRDAGYVSTTTDLKYTSIFIDKLQSCCLYKIRIRKGTSVLCIPDEIGVFEDESEILLFRGGTFHLIKTSETVLGVSRGIKTYHLDYIQAPLPMNRILYPLGRLHEYMYINKLDPSQLINVLA